MRKSLTDKFREARTCYFYGVKRKGCTGVGHRTDKSAKTGAKEITDRVDKIILKDENQFVYTVYL